MTKNWKLDKIVKYFIMRRLVLIIKLDELRAKPKQRMDFDFKSENVEGIKLKEPLEAYGVIEYIEDEIVVRGEYKVKIEVSCVKCLTDIAVSLQGEFNGHFSEGDRFKKHLDSLKKECDVNENYLDEAKNGEIDLVDLVREFIILDTPPYPSCEPECNGLEEAEMYSQKNSIDPRWQELLNIKN